MTKERREAASLRAERAKERDRERRQDVSTEERREGLAATQRPEAQHKRRGSNPEAAVVMDHDQLMAEPREVQPRLGFARMRRDDAERNVRRSPPQPVRAGLTERAVSVEVHAQPGYCAGCHALPAGLYP